MDRKNTIKILRDITRKLSDDALFKDEDFKLYDPNYDSLYPYTRVELFIKRKLSI